jgi:hypothetical protein
MIHFFAPPRFPTAPSCQILILLSMSPTLSNPSHPSSSDILVNLYYSPPSLNLPLLGEALRLWLCAHHRRERLSKIRGRHPRLPRARGAQEQGIQQESGHVEHRSDHLREFVVVGNVWTCGPSPFFIGIHQNVCIDNNTNITSTCAPTVPSAVIKCQF